MLLENGPFVIMDSDVPVYNPNGKVAFEARRVGKGTEVQLVPFVSYVHTSEEIIRCVHIYSLRVLLFHKFPIIQCGISLP